MADLNIVVRCPACEQHVIGQHQARFQDSSSDAYGEVLLYAFVVCPKCSRPFLLRREGRDEDPEDHHAEIHWEDRWTVLYPGGAEEVDVSVPKNIAESYLGARRCFFDASEYTGAAIMCRRTLEGICKHFDAKGGNLKGKLADLKTKGVIEPRIHGWADDVLRAVGNEAAHDVDLVINKQDAQDALEFTKAIIEYLYVFEAAFKRFKTRRSEAKEDKGGGGFSDS